MAQMHSKKLLCDGDNDCKNNDDDQQILDVQTTVRSGDLVACEKQRLNVISASELLVYCQTATLTDANVRGCPGSEMTRQRLETPCVE